MEDYNKPEEINEEDKKNAVAESLRKAFNPEESFVEKIMRRIKELAGEEKK